MRRTTVHDLRTHAVQRSLRSPSSLPAAMKRLGFVQADPIRAPARAQDLILRHRVSGYRANDLERRYPSLDLEEDMLYAYGFLHRDVWRLVHTPRRTKMTTMERRVLAALTERGATHPRDLDDELGTDRVVNGWGGFSTATKQALERLHRRGLARVVRRDKGIRVYAPAVEPETSVSARERYRRLALVAANIFAPTTLSLLNAALAPLRRRGMVDRRTAREVLDQLLDTGALEHAEVDGTTYVWPERRPRRTAIDAHVRLLAPFDPLVWDRKRFEHFWGWEYRFEAYTPKAKRALGYYAMPLLWRDDVIGWANVDATDDGVDVQLGFAKPRPRERAFTRALDAEIERLRVFLRPR